MVRERGTRDAPQNDERAKTLRPKEDMLGSTAVPVEERRLPIRRLNNDSLLLYDVMIITTNFARSGKL